VIREIRKEIPVTPLVKWWLTYKHGDVMRVSTNNVYGRQLFLSLGRKPMDRSKLCEAKYMDSYVVMLPRKVAKQIGREIEAQSVIDFNKAVKNVFLEFFCNLMDYERVCTELSIDKIYDKFIDTFDGIERSFDRERAKKTYLRYRNNKNVDRMCTETLSENVLTLF